MIFSQWINSSWIRMLKTSRFIYCKFESFLLIQRSQAFLPLVVVFESVSYYCLRHVVSFSTFCCARFNVICTYCVFCVLCTFQLVIQNYMPYSLCTFIELNCFLFSAIAFMSMLFLKHWIELYDRLHMNCFFFLDVRTFTIIPH